MQSQIIQYYGYVKLLLPVNGLFMVYKLSFRQYFVKHYLYTNKKFRNNFFSWYFIKIYINWTKCQILDYQKFPNSFNVSRFTKKQYFFILYGFMKNLSLHFLFSMSNTFKCYRKTTKESINKYRQTCINCQNK